MKVIRAGLYVLIAFSVLAFGTVEVDVYKRQNSDKMTGFAFTVHKRACR